MLNISEHKVQKEIEEGYDLYTLNTLPTPKTGKVLAQWIKGIALILFFALFLPWQQNIDGSGKVTALSPADRPQTVMSAIAGRIMDWRVREGQLVHKGDTLIVLAEIKDDYFDPELLIRTKEQLNAKQGSIDATKDQITAISNQVTALENGLRFSLSKARNKVRQGKLKVVSDSVDLRNESIQYDIAKVQMDRFEKLYSQKGLISLTELERRRAKFQENAAKVVSQGNKLDISRQEYLNALIELNSIGAEYGDKLSKAKSELAAKQSYLAEATGEYSKLRNKLASLEVRWSQHYVTAPQDGYVVRALRVGIGETIKEGESVVTIQPDRPGLAVELYVRAMDVPLVTRGRKVRIEFEGWPALQFSGWPSVQVGTFGGVVSVIDWVNSKDGDFRLLITPDPDEEPWPAQLRLGSGVYGWVMLDEVPVWFEIWRQLNAFPASLKKAPEDYATGKDGKAKEEEIKEKSSKIKYKGAK